MRPLRRLVQLSSAILAILLPPILLHAQGLAGEIRLDVKDPTGAVMQASGMLQNVQTGSSRSFQTDANGSFTFGNLTYGRYRVEVAGQGFATQSLLVDVQSSSPVSRTITMVLGVESAKVD